MSLDVSWSPTNVEKKDATNMKFYMSGWKGYAVLYIRNNDGWCNGHIKTLMECSN